MKILFLASNLSAIGGIQNYNKKFLGALKELGVDTDILELKNTSILAKIEFVSRFFIRILQKPDVVFCTHVSFSPLCFFAKKILRRKYTVSMYGIEVERLPWLEKRALASSDRIVYLFENTRRTVEKQIPETRRKFFLLPNSVDVERFTIKKKDPELIRRFGVRGKRVVYTICRLLASKREDKGYEKVLRALPLVLKEVPEVVYILAGGGDERVYIEQVAEKLNIKEHIILPGALTDEEMVDFYNLADVFILPSKREGFPAIVLLEALACGKPIIGGNQPGSDWFNGTFGIIVDPNNIKELAAAIVKILKGDIPANMRSSEWLRKRVQETYGPAAYQDRVREYLRVFE